MNRITFAFRAFFSILFQGALASDIAQAFGYSKVVPMRAPERPRQIAGPAEGAVQMLSILQRDARLVDFLMEDISAYPDEQVGAAVRDVQENARKSMLRYLQLTPVIDGVEGTFTKAENEGVKLIGNVPASGRATGGTLRHKGWRADRVDLPALPDAPSKNVIAPAEVEVE